MTSQLLLDRLRDDVFEVVDSVLMLSDVCHVLNLVIVESEPCKFFGIA